MNFLKSPKCIRIKLCKLYIVSQAQVQHGSNSWLKLSFNKQSQKLQNTLHGHPFLWPICMFYQHPLSQKSFMKIHTKKWMNNPIFTTSKGILSHPNANFWRLWRFWISIIGTRVGEERNWILLFVIFKRITIHKNTYYLDMVWMSYGFFKVLLIASPKV